MPDRSSFVDGVMHSARSILCVGGALNSGDECSLGS
eukprot:CAMPEP_0196218848 /NCGR_PEP_ID=MMETSP0912-20130531/37527_1 /TAXON_ID=49265 /ORGANISM="Thalassiosira rotula, Strain GSO102" /LENGTH=35 /DNA_ID= /DNA_START= /DNA_END= /DNA_ORIENTATION=